MGIFHGETAVVFCLLPRGNTTARVVFLTSEIQLAIQLRVVFGTMANDVESRKQLPRSTPKRNDTFLVQNLDLLPGSTGKILRRLYFTDNVPVHEKNTTGSTTL